MDLNKVQNFLHRIFDKIVSLRSEVVSSECLRLAHQTRKGRTPSMRITETSAFNPDEIVLEKKTGKRNRFRMLCNVSF